MVIPFIVIFLSSFFQSTGSENQIHFFDSNVVLNDLKVCGVKSKYYQNLDYESMLFIDKASLKTLLEINPDLLRQNQIDTSWICYKVPDKNVKWYPAESSTLEEFFSIPDKWKNVMKDFSQEFRRLFNKMELSDNIYIKNHRIAAFTLSCGSYSETYRATLINKKIGIELLYTIIE